MNTYTPKKNTFPAFPFPGFAGGGGHQSQPSNSGMSFRDYIAVKAMEGILNHPEYHPESPSRIAVQSYSLADAMLEKREV